MPKRIIIFGILLIVILVHRSWSDMWLTVGWILGYFATELDQIFYATVCNPHELSCQRVQSEIAKRDWKNAWRMLQDSKSERTKLPIHNIVTGLVLGILGVWLVTSSLSILASGLVISLGIKLFLEFTLDKNQIDWYWLMPKPLRLKEIWALILVLQLWLLVR
ncbi:hypothetical protein HZB69_01950 [Candidatus Amesbacteria bacterium]|nr:hypothetical protein [Candidatus Amesbacteria bacterium]